MRRTIIFFGLIAGIALFALPQLSSANTVPRIEYQRARILSLINELREDQNAVRGEDAQLFSIGLDDDLTNLAQLHAIDTATVYSYDTSSGSTETPTDHYIGHAGSDGSTLQGRVRAVDIQSIRAAAEIVGMRSYDPFEEEDVHDAISDIVDSIFAEVPPNDTNKTHLFGDFTHIGIGIDLYRELDDNPLRLDTFNALFLVIVLGEFTDDRDITIPDPATYLDIEEEVDTKAVRKIAKNLERFEYRVRKLDSAPVRGKSRKRVIYRKPPPPGTGLGVIVDPKSEKAERFYLQQWMAMARNRRLTASSFATPTTLAEYRVMRRYVRLQQNRPPEDILDFRPLASFTPVPEEEETEDMTQDQVSALRRTIKERYTEDFTPSTCSEETVSVGGFTSIDHCGRAISCMGELFATFVPADDLYDLATAMEENSVDAVQTYSEDHSEILAQYNVAELLLTCREQTVEEE